ncbi:unnamed protein product (macronuclear) [Paramecium tetraurelia]|uniref:VHS domain-containing protein n=1 Tax=Paramecium tetraurelia TaxID=5888 RepID=A0CLV9_PARTE|nr:uncharacterized protein GSPATT00038701001 [Paramecium tetraurelia]CAK71776.1 unnamed protein product [Paramecium tetraurelia]|eukprot:XP_001439173.1 hypothetical protein (macronuclear) [Paramecium tetraurelia strain d4-2]
MANQLDTISFSTQQRLHQYTPSIDSHKSNKQHQHPQNLDAHQINKEIQFIADYALKLIKTTQPTSDKYKYIIRIAEISMKAKEVDNNKKLLDDIVEELSIILAHSLKSKTVQILLTRLIQLYKKKQVCFINSEKNIKKYAQYFNNKPKNPHTIITNQIDSPRLNIQIQKSYSPTSLYQNSKITQTREHKFQIQPPHLEDPYNLNSEHLKALLSPSMKFQRQRNYYLSKY